MRPATALLAALLAAAAAAPPLPASDAPRPLPPEPPHTPAITAEEYLWADAWLSDDARKGREAGTPECREAARWIAARFKAMGLEEVAGAPGYLQPWDLPGSTPVAEECALAVLRDDEEGAAAPPPLAFGKEFVVMQGSASVSLDAPAVLAGYGITAPENSYDDFAGVDVKGKVAVVLRHEPREKDGKSRWNGDRMTRHSWFPMKVQAAVKAGAAAVVIVNDLANHDQDRVESAPAGAPGDLPVPVLMATRAFTDRLLLGSGLTPESWQKSIDDADAPASRALEGVRLRIATKLLRPGTENVVGMIRGSDPALRDEWIVVGAHYDHVGAGYGGGRIPGEWGRIHNGADDNASGTSAMLEVAEQFAMDGKRTRRSLLFLAFSGEEKGLLGAAHFVAHPLVPMDRVAAMINLDMVGRYRPGQFDVVGADSGSGLRETVAAAAEGLGLEYQFTNSGMANSDGFCFYNGRVPTLFLFTGLHDDYHRPGDDWWLINAEGAAKVATMAARMARSLADADGRPRYAPLPPEEFAMNRRNRVVLGVTLDEESKDGAGISAVSPRSPAAGGGLAPGDRVVSLAGRAVKSADDLRAALNYVRPGDTVAVKVIRGTEEKELTVAFPGAPAPIFGVVYGAEDDGKAGARVDEVAGGSVAEAAGLKAGDRILSFGGEAVAGGRALAPVLRKVKAGTTVKVRVLRDGKEVELEAVYPAKEAGGGGVK